MLRLEVWKLWMWFGRRGIEGMNENRHYFVYNCAKNGIFLANTFFKHKLILWYTWARGKGNTLIDYIVVVKVAG